MNDKTRAFLQGLSDGNLYRIVLGGSHDLLLMIREDGLLEFSALESCPFEEKLLQRAVDAIPEEAVFNYFSKAAIVARWLNGNLAQNQGKSPDEWTIVYYSGYA